MKKIISIYLKMLFVLIFIIITSCNNTKMIKKFVENEESEIKSETE